ncbi:MAG: hypothetical protein AAB687_00545 [Patescibacteria group bacterium]
MSKIKNIAILVTIVVVLVLSYIFFIKPSTDTTNLISATPVSTPDMLARAGDSTVARDFLTLLLNVKNIKLDDTIFSDKAFTSLRDSSITLTTDGTEGRPNPFAPLGVDNIAPTTPFTISPDISTTPTTPITPTPTVKKP